MKRTKFKGTYKRTNSTPGEKLDFEKVSPMGISRDKFKGIIILLLIWFFNSISIINNCNICGYAYARNCYGNLWKFGPCCLVLPVSFSPFYSGAVLSTIKNQCKMTGPSMSSGIHYHPPPKIFCHHKIGLIIFYYQRLRTLYQ